jgi:hypothetical protein
MPIGSSKLGVLGAGLVPGGSVTFNATGTWDVPPGVKVVSITGVGGTGNPGVAGNPGNPGNLGTGGSGGGGGSDFNNATRGGAAFRGTGGNFFNNANPINPAPQNNPAQRPLLLGGNITGGAPGNPGQQGQAGTAGTAGCGGTAGNTGQSSSALCNTFPGGAGGNAPPGGAAGNGGSGGNGGGAGNAGPGGNGGAGGNGGGSGTPGHTCPGGNQPCSPGVSWGGVGGGGAGATNDGASGINSSPANTPNVTIDSASNRWSGRAGRGGNTANYSVPASGPCQYPSTTPWLTPAIPASPNITGGNAGIIGSAPLNASNYSPPSVPGGNALLIEDNNITKFRSVSPPYCNNLGNSPAVTPFPLANPASQAVRSGGGGGNGGYGQPNIILPGGGGGGGGGRGNAGNAGGNSPTISGTAASPATFNCVPVTPGTPTPITVGAPGGQIVISWNPQ